MDKEQFLEFKKVIDEVYRRIGHLMGLSGAGVGENMVVLCVTSEEIKNNIEPLLTDLPVRIKVPEKSILMG